MTPWYIKDYGRFESERLALAERFPSLQLEVKTRGYWLSPRPCTVIHTPMAVVSGIFRIDPSDSNSVGYRGNLLVPDDYPDSNPLFYIDDGAIKFVADRHMFENGQACLCVHAEYRKHWSADTGLVGFLSNLVQPFVIAQYSYAKNGVWPWPTRKHGMEGIMQAYADITGCMKPRAILGFMEIMAIEQPPEGQSQCPCGSGKQLKFCHMNRLLSLRKKFRWQDVALDMLALRASLGRMSPEIL